MNGYLSTLAYRVVERAQPVRPRVASLFEPMTAPRIPLAEPSKRNARARTTSQHAAEPRDTRRPPATEQTHSPVTSSAISPAVPIEPSPQSIGAIAQARPTDTDRIETSESIRELSLPRDVSSKTEKPDEITFAAQAAAHRGEPLSPLVRAATVLERTVVSDRPITTIVTPAGEPAPKSDARSEQHHGAQVIISPEVKTSHDAPEPIEAPEIVREGAPAIRITIGRVDVRAIMPQAPTAAASPQHPQRNSALTLDDYLKKRNGASR